MPNGQFHFDPGTYLDMMRAEVPAYDELQRQAAAATEGIDVSGILELGVGTGETSRHVLDVHSEARLTGIDASEPMLEVARASLPPGRVRSLVVSRLEGPLPEGTYDLVVSVLAVHHLDRAGKADLFRRIAARLRPGGRFVLGDVIVPENPDEAVTPIEPGVDLPDPIPDLLRWMDEAGLESRLVWRERDLAVMAADRV